MKHARTALALLAAGVITQFLWLHVPEAMQGRVWNASQSLLIVALLCIVSIPYGWPVRLVALLVGSWQLLTAGCAIAYLWHPQVGRIARSLDYPLGMAALAASVGLAWLIYRESHHGRPHIGDGR